MSILQNLLGGNSKKLCVWLVSIALILLRDWIGLSLEDVWAIVGTGGAYTVGQGIADFGKEKAKVEAKNGHPQA